MVIDLDVSKVIPGNADASESQFFEEQVYRPQLTQNHGICPNENKSQDEAIKSIEEERRCRRAMNTSHARRREDCLSAEKGFFTKRGLEESDENKIP